MAGSTITARGVDFALLRYHLDGSLDLGFGNGSLITTDFFDNRDIADALAVQPDGKVVAAGIARAADSHDHFALARYDAAGLLLPDFSLSLNALQINAERGKKVRVTVNINRFGGFGGSVTVMPPNTAPIGIKPSPSDPISTTEGSLQFKLKIKPKTPSGPHQITFTGRDESGRVHTASLTLAVQ